MIFSIMKYLMIFKRLFIFFFASRGIQDLSSLNRGLKLASSALEMWSYGVLTTGPPGKSQYLMIFKEKQLKGRRNLQNQI